MLSVLQCDSLAFVPVWKAGRLAARLFPCADLIYTPQRGSEYFFSAVLKRDLRLRRHRPVKAGGPRGSVECAGKGRWPPRWGRTRSRRRTGRPVGRAQRAGPDPFAPRCAGAAVLERDQKVPRRTDEPSFNFTRGGCLRAAVALPWPRSWTGWAWLRGDGRRPQRGSPPSGLTLGHRRRHPALQAVRALGFPSPPRHGSHFSAPEVAAPSGTLHAPWCWRLGAGSASPFPWFWEPPVESEPGEPQVLGEAGPAPSRPGPAAELSPSGGRTGRRVRDRPREEHRELSPAPSGLRGPGPGEARGEPGPPAPLSVSRARCAPAEGDARKRGRVRTAIVGNRRRAPPPPPPLRVAVPAGSPMPPPPPG